MSEYLNFQNWEIILDELDCRFWSKWQTGTSSYHLKSDLIAANLHFYLWICCYKFSFQSQALDVHTKCNLKFIYSFRFILLFGIASNDLRAHDMYWTTLGIAKNLQITLLICYVVKIVLCRCHAFCDTSFFTYWYIMYWFYTLHSRP